MMSQPKVAVVGCGAAGMSAAYVLRDQAASLTLFEKSSALGGHAATVEVS